MPTEQGWEKLLGEDSFHRTLQLARDAQAYRGLIRASQPTAALLQCGKRLQVLGRNLEDIRWVEPSRPKPKPVTELLKHETHDDFDVILEVEWNTRGWEAAEIEGACDALLVEIENATATPRALRRKNYSLKMITKLLDRHSEATSYMIKNIEMFVEKALLWMKTEHVKFQNIMQLIVILANYLPEQLRALNVVGRLIRSMTLHVDTAIQIIQHTYRQFRIAKHSNPSSVRRDIIRSYRLQELLEQSWQLAKHAHNQRCNLKHSAYLHVEAELAALTAIYAMCAKHPSQDILESNREDVTRSGGVFLCTLIASPTDCSGRALHACRIIREVCRDRRLVLPLLETEFSARAADQARLILVLDSLCDLSVSLAQVRQLPDHELAKQQVQQMNLKSLQEDLQVFVRTAHLFQLLASIVLQHTNVKILLPTLKAIWCFASIPEVYDVVLDQMAVMNGKVFMRLIQLLENHVAFIAQTSMRVLVQLCRREEGRSMLITCCCHEPLRQLAHTQQPWQACSPLYALICMQALIRHGTESTVQLPDPRCTVKILLVDELVQEFYRRAFDCLCNSIPEQLEDSPFCEYKNMCNHVSAHVCFAIGGLDPLVYFFCNIFQCGEKFTAKLTDPRVYQGAMIVSALTDCRHGLQTFLQTAVIKYMGFVLVAAYTIVDNLRKSNDTIPEHLARLILEGATHAATTLCRLVNIHHRDDVNVDDLEVQEGTDNTRVTVLKVCMETRCVPACAFLTGMLPTIRCDQFSARLRNLTRDCSMSCCTLLQTLTPTLLHDCEVDFPKELCEIQRPIIDRLRQREANDILALFYDAFPYLSMVLNEIATESVSSPDPRQARHSIEAIVGCVRKLTSIPQTAEQFIQKHNGFSNVLQFFPSHTGPGLLDTLAIDTGKPWANYSVDGRKIICMVAEVFRLYRNMMVVPGTKHACIQNGVLSRIIDYIVIGSNALRSNQSGDNLATLCEAFKCLCPLVNLHTAGGKSVSATLLQQPTIIFGGISEILCSQTRFKSTGAISSILEFLRCITEDLSDGAVCAAKFGMLRILTPLLHPENHVPERLLRDGLMAVCNICKAIVSVAADEATKSLLMYYSVYPDRGVLNERRELCSIAQEALFHITKSLPPQLRSPFSPNNQRPSDTDNNNNNNNNSNLQTTTTPDSVLTHPILNITHPNTPKLPDLRRPHSFCIAKQKSADDRHIASRWEPTRSSTARPPIRISSSHVLLDPLFDEPEKLLVPVVMSTQPPTLCDKEKVLHIPPSCKDTFVQRTITDDHLVEIRRR